MAIESLTIGFGALARRYPGLGVALLHGSRARGNAHQNSDWDIAVLADADTDQLGLRADVVNVLGTDEVDLVDLGQASALLRFRAASEGQCLFERSPGDYQAFVLAATLFWCDAESVIRRAGATVLSDLAL